MVTSPQIRIDPELLRETMKKLEKRYGKNVCATFGKRDSIEFAVKEWLKKKQDEDFHL